MLFFLSNTRFGTLFVLSEGMKRSITFISAVLLSIPLLWAQSANGNNQNGNGTTPSGMTLPAVEHSAFGAGEVLVYRLHYGAIDAGEARLEVKESSREVKGRKTYQVVGEGKSIGAFDWFFKVRDRYETYLDQEGVFPWVFIRRVSEGGHEISQDYVFHQNKQSVVTEKGNTHDVPVGVQDMLSAFYYARTLDFTDAEVGDIFTVNCFVDEELFELKIKYQGKEVKKTRLGKYNCLVFNPVVQTGRIFKDEEDLTVWITDDANKIPLLAKAKIVVGSIKMELTGYDGLANDLNTAD